ncbi:hypothetical protein [Vibrio sp. WXL210]|uniref:hypothetical protein n=1 Tax=Vibrio sp. WXL210 TaxID=3450709 RepID=UPI003EC7A771
MERCGQCRQFTRTRENQKDLCGAWEQPTVANRPACGFYLPKKRSVLSEKNSSDCCQSSAQKTQKSVTF